MINFHIKPLPRHLIAPLQQKTDGKTKPPGSLGQLERLALKVGLIQGSLAPSLRSPAIMVFAGDHGIVAEGVSPYPQAVTHQMVLNFLNGGAAINVFANQNGMALQVVDAGVNYAFAPHPQLVDAKIAMGTRNFMHQPAMTMEQCCHAIEKGADLVRERAACGTNVIAFGEMGIGNTSSAAVLMSSICGIPLAECVGRGTGLDDAGLARKRAVLEKAVQKHRIDRDPLMITATFGGFEIAMMVGAMLRASELGMVLLVDGFIVTVALLVASQLHPGVLDYCIFAHKSDERGHATLLDILGAEPVLSLGMRLGEGTGAAVAFPIVQAAVNFLNQMASFESAGVSNKVAP